MADILLGYKNILLTPFSDSAFTKDTGNEQNITTDLLLAETPIVIMLSDQVERRPFADGSIIIFTGVNDNPGSIKFTIGKVKGIDDILLLLFPEAFKATSGSISSILFTKPIGANRSSWANALHVTLKDPTLPLDQSLWIEGRVSVNTPYDAMLGADLSKLEVTLDLIGADQLTGNSTDPYILRVGDNASGLAV